MSDQLNFPATERNREPILAVLKEILPQKGHILEIASGSGEHVVHFAPHYKDIIWQPSDLDERCLRSINAWTTQFKLKNVKMPLEIDTTRDENWPHGPFDGVTCINMIHISPWAATVGLMKRVSERLNTGGFLYLYGPYRQNGAHTSPSNAEFEQWLKGRDASWGIRDLADVESEAAKNGLTLKNVTPMPANNFSVVFRKI